MAGYGAKGLTFTFELGGAVQYRRTFEGVIGDLQDFTPAFEQIGTTLREHWFEVFVTEGEAAGGKWVPLERAYEAWKAKRYPGQTILTRSGALARAMTLRGAAGNIEQISAMSAIYGASRRTPNGKWDLGLIHQEGTDDKRVPARPIVKLPQKVKSRITRILRAHINQEA